MEPLLIILAAAGVSAALVRLARSVFRLIQRVGEAWILGEATSSRERRGDLTGMDEVARLSRRARVKRARAFFGVVFWMVLLVVPTFTPWTAPIYATYSMLWLTTIGSGRARVRRPGRAPRTRGDDAQAAVERHPEPPEAR